MIRRALYVTAIVAGSTIAVLGQRYQLQDQASLKYTRRFSGAGERTMTVRNINGVIRVAASTDPAVQVEVLRTVTADSEADLRLGEREAAIATADQRADLSAIVRDRFGSSCGESNRRGSDDRLPYQDLS